MRRLPDAVWGHLALVLFLFALAVLIGAVGFVYTSLQT